VRHRKGAELAARKIRFKRGEVVDDHVDLAREEREHRRLAALERHDEEIDAGLLLEELRGHLHDRARTGGGDGVLAGRALRLATTSAALFASRPSRTARMCGALAMRR
jgi:hypothetical protein